MIPIILAGGSGTRFWPLSRWDSPKQLLSLLGEDERSMIQVTVDRLEPLLSEGQTVQILCREDLVPPTREVLRRPDEVSFVVEPAKRNTAPAVALGTARAEAHSGDEVVGFFPADHFVGDEVRFQECLRFATRRAEAGAILTVGIPPTRPETGYGYIECGDELAGDRALQSRAVRAFVEKPDKARALAYLQAGNFLWNGGIFLFRPSTLWREIQRQRPALWEHVAKIRDALAGGATTDSPEVVRAFSQMESISIDYAVMEGAEHVEVIPATFRWSDVGHWGALDEVLDCDDDGNVVHARARLRDVKRCILYSRGTGRAVAAIGLEDMVVVDTPDALLVLPKSRAQEVRELVAGLEDDLV